MPGSYSLQGRDLFSCPRLFLKSCLPSLQILRNRCWLEVRVFLFQRPLASRCFLASTCAMHLLSLLSSFSSQLSRGLYVSSLCPHSHVSYVGARSCVLIGWIWVLGPHIRACQMAIRSSTRLWEGHKAGDGSLVPPSVLVQLFLCRCPVSSSFHGFIFPLHEASRDDCCSCR